MLDRLWYKSWIITCLRTYAVSCFALSSNYSCSSHQLEASSLAHLRYQASNTCLTDEIQGGTLIYQIRTYLESNDSFNSTTYDSWVLTMADTRCLKPRVDFINCFAHSTDLLGTNPNFNTSKKASQKFGVGRRMFR